MQLRLRTYSYRFAEQVLNSKLSLKEEIRGVIENLDPDPKDLSRPRFNERRKEVKRTIKTSQDYDLSENEREYLSRNANVV